MDSSNSKLVQVLKNYRFSIILLAGVVVGAVIGFVFGEKTLVLQPFADVFLNLVFCLIVPVVFVSIANSIANMGNLKKLGKVLGIFFAITVIGGLITSLLAVGAVAIFNPAKGVTVEFAEEIDPGNTSLNFVNMFTTSDFVNLLSIKNMMALIMFAILFGIAVASIGKKGEPVVNLFTALSEALSKMVSIVMLYAPIGIACYFATLIGKMGSQIIGSVARMSIIYVVFCTLFFIAYGTIVPFLGGGREAVRRYWTHIWLPATTAAGACSSTACIPVNYLATKKMGISEEISSLVIPLGASMHKNGVISVQIVKIAFLFGVFHMVMGPQDIVKAVIVALISGIIVGTIPSGGFIGEMFICTAFGFPTSVIPIIVIMGTLTDPFCTMNNVTGDPAMAMLLTRIVEGKDWIKNKIEEIKKIKEAGGNDTMCTNKEATPEEIILQDLEEIYIGNLNTVEADLTLPDKGRLGADLRWESKETLFLSNEGKVTRPAFGVGNRIVPLIATAQYKDACREKEFLVTVLEQPRDSIFVNILPVNIKAAAGTKASLPPVVIATEDTGVRVTLPVVWEEYEIPAAPCKIQVAGKVETVDLAAVANIEFLAHVPEEQEIVPEAKAPSVPAGTVKLKDGTLFYDAQERMIQYLLQVDDDQMLYNFRSAAGLDTKKAPPMTGWDAPGCNLKGHTTGHYLSALAFGWSVTDDHRLSSKITYMVDSLEECQDALLESGGHFGFLSAYSEEQFDLLEQFTTYPTIWAPYYTLDKIMSGLLDCYSIGKNQKALKIVAKMGDWVFERLSKLSQKQLDKMWSLYIAGEFGGMISVMVQLYHLTRKETYKKAACCFCNEKLFYPMQENIDTLKDMHANQHIPQIIGSLELYKAGSSSRYLHIAKNFWNMVTSSHAYSIGGVGETEMFHEPDKLFKYISDKTAESCASYNMLRLTSGLFALYPDSSFMDYYELVLYNHIMASASHTHDGGTIYFMPLRPAGQKEYTTDENTCCHGTGLESRFRYIHDIYSCNENELYVNLYIASVLDTDTMKLELNWSMDQPEDSLITIKTEGERTICLRVPVWTREGFTLKVCGEEQNIEVSPDGYIRILRTWSEGDTIEVHMSYDFRMIPVTDNRDIVSIAYGPFLLAALSERVEYLQCPEDAESLKASMKAQGSTLHFNWNGITYVPVSEVDEERYHVYFRRR